MGPLRPELRAAAEVVLGYLGATDPIPAAPVDAIIGFGMFDLALPRHCGDLHRRGVAPRILFTGGIGAVTGLLGGPEADAWRAELRRTHPEIGDDAVIVENRSTNTAENIDFTAALLHRAHPALAVGAGIRRALIVASPSRLRRVGLRRAIIVASPSRLRRVALTLRLKLPGLTVYRAAPACTLEGEYARYAAEGLDYLDHLAGELDRIAAYPARGWIAPEPLPPAIAAAHAVLRTAA